MRKAGAGYDVKDRSELNESWHGTDKTDRWSYDSKGGEGNVMVVAPFQLSCVTMTTAGNTHRHAIYSPFPYL